MQKPPRKRNMDEGKMSDCVIAKTRNQKEMILSYDDVVKRCPANEHVSDGINRIGVLPVI